MALLDFLHVEPDSGYGAVRQLGQSENGDSATRRDATAKSGVWVTVVDETRQGRSTRGYGIVLLDGKLSSLARKFVSFFLVNNLGSTEGPSYRQDSQQGGLPCVLQTYHGHIHFGRPVALGQHGQLRVAAISGRSRCDAWRLTRKF